MTDPGRRLILHLGAHKTASTHYNRTVRRNSARLEAHGVHHPRKEVIRAQLTRHLGGPLPRLLGPAGRIGPELLDPAAATTFISDENILGEPFPMFGKRRFPSWAYGPLRAAAQRAERILDPGRLAFYPQSGPRISKALTRLGGRVTEVQLAIRHPATFTVSSYGEAIRTHGYLDFDSYLGGVRPEDLIWSPIVEHIRDIAPELRIVVWRFEDYGRLVDALLARLIATEGTPLAGARPVDRTVRPGLSQKAIDEIHALEDRRGRVPPKEELEELVGRFPKSDTLKGPDPWSAAQKARLDAVYSADRARIERIEGVEVLRPD